MDEDYKKEKVYPVEGHRVKIVDYYPSERGGGKKYRRMAKVAAISGRHGIKPWVIRNPTEKQKLKKKEYEQSEEEKRYHHRKVRDAMRYRNQLIEQQRAQESLNRNRFIQRMYQSGNPFPTPTYFQDTVMRSILTPPFSEHDLYPHALKGANPILPQPIPPPPLPYPNTPPGTYSNVEPYDIFDEE